MCRGNAGGKKEKGDVEKGHKRRSLVPLDVTELCQGLRVHINSSSGFGDGMGGEGGQPSIRNRSQILSEFVLSPTFAPIFKAMLTVVILK